MDDLISRQAAIYVVGGWFKKIGLNGDICLDAIVSLPSAQPERKKGTWTDDASCPFCGFKPWYERDIHTLSFCPNCGADMRGEG